MFLKMLLLHRFGTEILLTTYFVTNTYYNLLLYRFWANCFFLVSSNALEARPANKWLGLLVKQSGNPDRARVMERHTLKIDSRLYKADSKDEVPSQRMNGIQNL